MSERDDAVHAWRGEPEHREVYLGDGLYASFDGWHFTLRAPRQDGDHFVYLEFGKGGTLERFLEYVRNAEAAE